MESQSRLESSPQYSCCKPQLETTSEATTNTGLFEGVSTGFLIRLIVSIVLAGQAMALGLGVNISPPPFGSISYWATHGALFGVALLVIGLIGRQLFLELFRSLKNARFTLEGLFVLSILGALGASLISTLKGTGGVFYEVVIVVLVIYALGYCLKTRAHTQAKQSTKRWKETFDFVYCLGETMQAEPKRLAIEKLDCCSQVLLRPGEALAVDGLVLSGTGYVQETTLTGALEPVRKSSADMVWAGSYSVDGTFVIKPTALKGKRRLDHLLEALEGAACPIETFETQANAIMRWFLPLVMILALGTFSFWTARADWVTGLFNSMSVLLVACPCAIGLATPIALWSSVCSLCSFGLVVKDGSFLNALSKAKRIAFDKTGTLIPNAFVVEDFQIAPGLDPNRVKALVKSVQHTQNHPVARALLLFLKDIENSALAQEITFHAGLGVSADVVFEQTKERYTVAIGEKDLMPHKEALFWKSTESSQDKWIYVSIDTLPAACVRLSAPFPEETLALLNEFSILGLDCAIITGDSHVPGCKGLEAIEIYTGLKPEEKAELLENWQQAHGPVVYVGDASNDAPAMRVSAASIAIEEGAGITKTCASAILTAESLNFLPKVILYSRRLKQFLRANMRFAICYNMIGISCAACGILHPVGAALLMLGSSLFVCIRSAFFARKHLGQG